MAWVKLHDDILGDPKLMRAARVGGTELVLLPWLLAFASKAADHGRLSVGSTAAEPEDIAYQTPGVTAAQVEACLRTLVAIGVLTADDDGCLRFAKWEDRQAKPSASKTAIRERVQKHRDKKRGNAKKRNTSPALQGVTGGASEPSLTPGVEGVTPCNATEKRRGEEKREEKRVSADAEPAAPIVTEPPRPTEKADPFPKAICDAGYEAYIARIGGVDYGRYRKALLPIYRSALSAHPTAEQLVAATEAFAEAREADNPRFRHKYTVEALAGALHEHVRVGSMPFVDEWGEPTERGRIAGMGVGA